MAINIELLKMIANDYGLSIELPELEDPPLSGRVAILSGTELPARSVLDVLTKRLLAACPELVRVMFDITPKSSRPSV